MLYFSTRDKARNGKPFSEIVLEGLAADGGLYIPAQIPTLDMETLRAWSHETYEGMAVQLLQLYAPELEQEINCSLKQLVRDSTQDFDSPQITPLKQLGDSPIYIGELFHSPTYAFKDIALQFLGQVFERLLRRQGRKLALLGATSGDTGGAAIYGVRGMNNIQLTVLHPHNAISEVQRKQMCTILDENIHNIAIKGSFDQCQNMVKEIMERGKRDDGIPRLGAINSINWGRILAQMNYYFNLYFGTVASRPSLQVGDAVRFVVPTGNFGNVLAGYFARRMGLPIKLLIASNHNDILHQCITHNFYKAEGPPRPSLAPAMDIVQPSNFERYLWYLFDGDGDGDGDLAANFVKRARAGKPQELSAPQLRQLRGDFESCSASDADILQAIARCHNQYGYVLDPHAACAYHACRQLSAETFSQMPNVCLATAHPAKFPAAYRSMNGAPQAPPIYNVPPGLNFSGKEERFVVLKADTEALLQHLRRQVW